MNLSQMASSTGLELVKETPWGGFLLWRDPNGVSSSPLQMVQVRKDGMVRVWADVDESMTPDDAPHELGDFVDYLDMAQFHDRVFEDVIQNQLAGEGWTRVDVMTAMWAAGWQPMGGEVVHGNDHTKRFPNWFEAIKWCIAQASSV